MPAPRVRSQLTIQASPDLLARVRGLADQRRQTVTAVVVEALEALLAGRGSAAAPAGAHDLAARLEVLEARVSRLEARPAITPPPPAAGRAAAPAATDPTPPAAMPEEAIPTAELARLTGTAATGWNRWAAGHRPGDVWNHPRFGPWRLLGKTAAQNGGTPRWMWEPVTASDGQA